MAAITSSIIGSVGSFVAANMGAIATGAKVYTDIQTSEAQTKASKEQMKMAKEQQEQEKARVQNQKRIELAKRKDKINIQRKQILGAGDSDYSLNQTSSVGASGGSLTGVSLG